VIAAFITPGGTICTFARGTEGGLSLSSQPSVTNASPAPHQRPAQPISIGWALRRTALWLLMMFVMVVAGMWLFYASIDPDEAVAGSPTTAESPLPQR
jgi:hypothetical protein